MKQRTTQSDFITFLKGNLKEKCLAQGGFSLRAYAKELGIDASSLSKILQKKRRLGPSLVIKLSKKLGLPPTQINEYVTATASQSRSKNTIYVEETEKYEKLDQETYSAIADWYHFAILELVRTDDFDSSPSWIAKKLGIRKQVAEEAVTRLLSLQMLKRDGKGKLVDATSGRSTTLPQPYYHDAHRDHERQLLEIAIRSISDVPVARRSISSITMAVDSDLIPEAKERIRKFRRELGEFLSQGRKRDAVYNLSVGIFPLSTVINNKNNNKELDHAEDLVGE